jgi:hypothetical protein
LNLPKGQIAVDVQKKTVRFYDGETQGGFELPSRRAFDLGPGGQEFLSGTGSQGYLGEVSPNILFTGSELIAEVGISSGVGINSDENWLKFASQGRILYVAKKPIMHSVSWATLYQAGAVYGVSGVGTNPVVEETLQLIPLIKGNYAFKLRLLTGGDADPSNGRGGEWDRLINAVAATGDGDVSLGSLSNADLGLTGNGSQCWMQESVVGASASRVTRGGSNATTYGSSANSSAGTALGWRPVLELISLEDLLFPLENLWYTTDYVKPVTIYDFNWSDAPLLT